MKTLTLWQPYATLLAHGFKVHETRSWYTHYRGELAIHASKRWTKQERGFVNDLVIKHPALSDYAVYEWELGYVVATCKIVDCVPTDHIRDHVSELIYDLGDYGTGRFAFMLDDIQCIEPIAANGKQGFWNWEAG